MKDFSLRRFIVRLLIVVPLLAVLWFALDLRFVLDGAETDHAQPADVILVLGCQIYGDDGVSSCIIARADHAADVYKQGLSSHVITSGGFTQSPNQSEAAKLAELMEQEGVPQAAIVLEESSLNTIQNMVYSKKIMQDHNWNNAILITEPYHINRATLIAHDQNITVYPSPAVNSPQWLEAPRRTTNVTRDTLSLMLYDVKRLTGSADR